VEIPNRSVPLGEVGAALAMVDDAGVEGSLEARICARSVSAGETEPAQKRQGFFAVLDVPAD
jgi:hypothetical protein